MFTCGTNRCVFERHVSDGVELEGLNYSIVLAVVLDRVADCYEQTVRSTERTAVFDSHQ